ncbi:hypothetical protein JHK87_024552 [Glycine soja]|nr:hypothetical protein JHK87_024552 [Glycine soja]
MFVFNVLLFCKELGDRAYRLESIDHLDNPFVSMYFGVAYVAWLSEYEGRCMQKAHVVDDVYERMVQSVVNSSRKLKEKKQQVKNCDSVDKQEKTVALIHGILKNRFKHVYGKTSSENSIGDGTEESYYNDQEATSDRHVKFSVKDDILGPKMINSIDETMFKISSHAVASSPVKEKSSGSDEQTASLEPNRNYDHFGLGKREEDLSATMGSWTTWMIHRGSRPRQNSTEKLNLFLQTGPENPHKGDIPKLGLNFTGTTTYALRPRNESKMTAERTGNGGASCDVNTEGRATKEWAATAQTRRCRGLVNQVHN